jgi:LemA protein
MDNAILLFIIAIVVIIAIVYIYLYNKIVGAKQNVHEAWAGVDVQLTRRHDLIGNLVTVAKGYAAHEKQLLEKITEERSRAASAEKKDLQKLSTIESTLGQDVQSFFAVAEAYPNLKANTVYIEVQNNLTETEDQIASSRRIYNGNVALYNTMIAIFPQNLVAKLNHFTQSQFFQNNKS